MNQAQRLISRSKLARLAGVSPAAVTKACKTGLKDAIVGKRLDLDHDSVREYLVGKGVDPTQVELGPAKRVEKARAKVEKAEADPGFEGPANIDEILEWKFRDIIDRFGGAPGFSDWLDARKRIGDIQALELKNAESQGRVIRRELVRAHIFGALDGVCRRLLLDASRTGARKLYSACRSGTPLEEAEKILRDLIGSQLEPLRDQVSEELD